MKIALEFLLSILIIQTTLTYAYEAQEQIGAPISEKYTNADTNLEYLAKADTLPINDSSGNLVANIFYTSYHVKANKCRPVTFVFNGGPGASSVWLHLGAFGPKMLGNNGFAPPYSLQDNPYSLLEVTDLVFVDPISTGYSKAAKGVDPSKYYNVNEDVNMLAAFIRSYVSKFNLWNCPKYLMGESYGGYRIAGLASQLQGNDYMFLNGIILLSPVINFQVQRDPGHSNDLPYPLFLPSYAVAANYHNKITQRPLNELIEQVTRFVSGPYLTALFKGDRLTTEEYDSIVDTLQSFTGLSKETIRNNNLRIPIGAFEEELLKNENKEIGRFDSRYSRPPVSNISQGLLDPSIEPYLGHFASGIHSYLSENLNWKSTDPYVIITHLGSWNYGANNSFASYEEDLKTIMLRNKEFRIFNGSGYYDLATPFYAVHYSLDHLGLDKKAKERVVEKYYLAGHMLYLDKEVHRQLYEDLKDFYLSTPKNSD